MVVISVISCSRFWVIPFALLITETLLQAWHSWAVVNFECVLFYKNKMDLLNEATPQKEESFFERGERLVIQNIKLSGQDLNYCDIIRGVLHSKKLTCYHQVLTKKRKAVVHRSQKCPTLRVRLRTNPSSSHLNQKRRR